MAAVAPKRPYKGRPKDCVPRCVNLDRESDRMLMVISNGRYSACLRRLITLEYGRLLALGEVRSDGTVAGDAHA